MGQTLKDAAESCELEVTFGAAQQDRLNLTYRFYNRGTRNAYLFNLLFHDEPDGERIDSNLVTVEVGEAGVTVGKKIVKVPDMMFVEKPYVPFVTRVPPGARFEETIEVQLPFRPWTPYFMPDDAALQPRPVAAELWFELGYFFSTPEGDAEALTFETPRGPVLYFDPFPFTSQKILRVGPTQSRYPILLPK